MANIRKAVALANNEVAFIAWQIDQDAIPGCLGFHLVREYVGEADAALPERPIASYVPFEGQHNSKWQAQNTTVWPIQKFTWRDLTLRKKRDGSGRRPDNERVRYRIQAVGEMRHGLEPVVVIPERHRDKATGHDVHHSYEGEPLALGYLTPPAFTNVIDVTSWRPPFRSTFTNGILSTQFLRNVLFEDGKIEDGELASHLQTPGDWLRKYLAGDVIPLMREFFKTNGNGRFLAALYELDDAELVDLLAEHADRIDLILSDAGTEAAVDEDGEPLSGPNGKPLTAYDARNRDARERLRALADRPGSTFRLINRMFNGSGHIGHNKFVVYLPDGETATSVLTGSTNWTWTGLAGQSNNCTVIEDAEIAAGYAEYWGRLKDDEQGEPEPLSAKATGAGQDDELKEANRTPVEVSLADGATLEAWYAPNMPGRAQPRASKTEPPETPPDMSRLFSLMRQATRAIFFLEFYPSVGGANSIVGEAVNLGLNDSSLEVIGAVSSPQAMWGYEKAKTEAGRRIPAWSPRVFQRHGVSVVRATALTDASLANLGDFKPGEQLTAFGNGIGAIIHDKILVLDPQDAGTCVVAFGSHNQGFKASYSNDENLVIVRGHQALAQAYAVHVLDVFDHYRFRAVEAEIAARNKGRRNAAPADESGWDGFLDRTAAWQGKASRRLANYFTE